MNSTKVSARLRWLAAPALVCALGLTGCATTVPGNAAPAIAAASANSSPVVAVSSPSPLPSTAPSAAVPSVPPAPSVPSVPVTTSDHPSTGADSSAGAVPVPGTATSKVGGVAGGREDAKTFTDKLDAAMSRTKTVKATLSVSGTLAESGTMSETLSGGRVTGIDMSINLKLSGQDVPLKMKIVDGKTYLNSSLILSSLDVGSKHWALVSAKSSNATLRSMAASLDGVLSSANAAQYSAYSAASTSIVDKGPTRVGSIPAHRYQLTVDVGTLADSMPAGLTATAMRSLASSGTKTIPVTLSLDSAGRMVEAVSSIAMGGVTSTTDFKVIAYDEPVTIAAPAASDVYIG